jgi:hypothetical protein
VRRRPAGPPDEIVLSPVLGARRLAEAEAMMLQFQDQIDVLAAGSPESVAALNRFRWLPPAGVIPLAGAPAFRGFRVDTFFQAIKVRDPSSSRDPASSPCSASRSSTRPWTSRATR